jgi:hypothetical protein
MLILHQDGASSNHRLLRRSQPYRNERIINTIREIYFTGGVASFATRFKHFFPRHRDSQGVTKTKVSDQMVALVATAVMNFTLHASMSMLTCDAL